MKYKSCEKMTKSSIYDGNMANTLECINTHIFFIVKLLNGYAALSRKYKHEILLQLFRTMNDQQRPVR